MGVSVCFYNIHVSKIVESHKCFTRGVYVNPYAFDPTIAAGKVCPSDDKSPARCKLINCFLKIADTIPHVKVGMRDWIEHLISQIGTSAETNIHDNGKSPYIAFLPLFCHFAASHVSQVIARPQNSC